jgi:hypothetical protein
MTATVLTSYIGQGLLAARPATPTLVTGAAGFWYSTDTNILSVYAGGAWHDIVSGAPTLIQQKAVVNTNSVTLGAAPTQGNLLLAITTDLGTSETASAGWTKISFTSAANDGSGFFWKVAGVSESATQTPLTGLSTGSCTIFELNNATPAALFANNVDLSGTAIAASITAAKSKSGIILGVASNRSAAVAPTSITNATMLGAAVQGGSRTVQPFKVTAPAQGVNTVTANYASSQGAAIPMIEVG